MGNVQFFSLEKFLKIRQPLSLSDSSPSGKGSNQEKLKKRSSSFFSEAKNVSR